MRKDLIVLFEDRSSWDSCADINDGFLEMYAQDKNITIEQFKASSEPDSGKKLFNEIKDKVYEKIIFLDHRIRIPKELIHFVKYTAHKDKCHFHFIFHLYGCFLGRIEDWRFVSDHLQGCRVDFVVSSESHGKLIEKVLNLSSPPIICPFPVLNQKLKISNTFSKEDFGLSKDDILLIYPGRVSPGKNVLELCESIFQINEKSDFNIYLLIVGAIDDFAWPEWRSWNSRGAMCIEFAKVLKRVNTTKKIVFYHSHISEKDKLYNLYDISDAVISLSTMLGEDYGMLIADAIALNKKVICTYWGGYKVFKHYSQEIEYVKVCIEDDNLFISQDDIENAIRRTFTSSKTCTYNNQLSSKKLFGSFNNQLFRSKSQVIGLNKVARILEGMTTYQIFKNTKLRKVYDSYWN